MKELRPFEDLIKTIDIDGKVFVPIEVIAELAFDNNNKLHLNTSIQKIESGIFLFSEVTINKSFPLDNDIFIMTVDTDYDVSIIEDTQNEQSIVNQVQIVKNLIKWGFIEP